MDKLLKAGCILFAIGIAGLGVLHFITHNYIVGRPPAITWPAWAAQLPGKTVWAYISGIFLIAAALLLALEIQPYQASIALGSLIIVYSVVLRHTPAMTDLTNEYKSLAIAGSSFIVASSFLKDKYSRKFFNLLFAGQMFIAWFLIFCGMEHFKFDDFVITIVPSYLSYPYFWTYFAGVLLIAGGIGTLYRPTRKWAASLCGIMVLLWCFMLHIPRAVSVPVEANYPYGEWMGVCETIIFGGAFFVIAALASSDSLPKKLKKPKELQVLSQ